MPEQQGQAPNEPPKDGTTPPEGTPPAQNEGQAPDPAMTADELSRARSEAAKYRTELREAKAKLEAAEKAQKERDDAEKSELQKATERTTLLEAEVKERDERIQKLSLRHEVVLQASKLGIVDPDAAYKLLDKKDVEYEDGEPTNVEALLTKLLDEKPYLKGKAGPAGGKTPSPTTPSARSKDAPLTMADVNRMTDDEIAARFDEVQKVLAEQGA